MSRKLVFIACLFVLLFSLLYIKFNPVEADASNGYPVHNLDTGLNYTTIQEAIGANETLDGHKIFVEIGVYYEQVTIDKSITLQGEDRETTVIDGNETGTVVSVMSNNVTISDFTIRNSGRKNDTDSGICAYNSSDNNISLNIVTNNYIGIYLHFSDNNILTCNNASSNNQYGLLLDCCCNNVLAKNTALNNQLVGIQLRECSNNNTLLDNAVSDNKYHGIQLTSSSNNNSLMSNNVTNNDSRGIWLWDSSNNNLVHNKIESNEFGMHLSKSSNNRLRNNSMTGNQWNFGVFGSVPFDALLEYIQDIDTSNTVDGKPIYYWVNRQNEKIPLDAGCVGLVNSTNITVENLELKKNFQALLLSYTKNSLIKSNNLTNNFHGINLVHSFNNTLVDNNITNTAAYSITLYWQSNNNMLIDNNIAINKRGFLMMEVSNNTIMNNNITNSTESGISLSTSNNNELTRNKIAYNNYGIRLGYSSNNRIYHNNFINNTGQAWVHSSYYRNIWDNGYPSGGNYWSDYNGTDSNPDGICDTAYVIETYSFWDASANRDNYPLMGTFSSFNTTLGKHVNVISNSTIEDFEYFESNNTIKMYVSNMTANQTFGFCRVCISHTLVNPDEISVVIDNGVTPVLYHNYTLYDNGTHRWIYFAYPHSIHEIDIIPEFPLIIIMPLFMIATLPAFILCRRKHSV